jgi:hypothetical protein
MSQPADIVVENREVSIAGKPFSISVITFHKLLVDDMQAAQIKMGAAYQDAATKFLASPAAAEQRSACVLSDITPLKNVLTPQIVKAWFDGATTAHAQTQMYLVSMFHRPVFQINVILDLDPNRILKLNQHVDPTVNQPYYERTLDEGITLATWLLKLAHRL